MITSNWTDYINAAGVLTIPKDEYEVHFILDILEGCKYRCPGCFVKKRGNYNSSSLTNALDTVEKIPFTLNDIVVGPTDFFGADNILDILKDDRMKTLCSNIKGIQHNTSIDENIDDSFVEEVIDFLESNPEYSSLNYDVQIAVDLNSLLYDEKYQSLVDDRWKTFEESSLNYEVSFLSNIENKYIPNDNYIQEFVNKRWGTVVEYVPSIMRSNNFKKVKETLDQWKTYDTRYNQHADPTYRAHNYILVSFNKDKVYLAPFIYEVAVVYNEKYEVTPDNIIEVYNNIINEQYKEAGSTCQQCSHLNSCVHRLIPYYTINSLGEEDYCPLNLELL